jgi:hypothetical protein
MACGTKTQLVNRGDVDISVSICMSMRCSRARLAELATAVDRGNSPALRVIPAARVASNDAPAEGLDHRRARTRNVCLRCANTQSEIIPVICALNCSRTQILFYPSFGFDPRRDEIDAPRRIRFAETNAGGNAASPAAVSVLRLATRSYGGGSRGSSQFGATGIPGRRRRPMHHDRPVA